MRRDIFVVYMTSLVLGSGMIGCSTNDVIVNEHEHDISQTKVHISEMLVRRQNILWEQNLIYVEL